jgi:hypothetical protein
MNGAVVYMQISLEIHSTVGYYTAESAMLESSFAEWTVKWWQWVYSIPKTNNPITDSTGELSEVGQSGEVWFLGGKPADTSSKLPIRNCCIPSDVSILFPVINCEANQIEFPLFSDRELVEYVTEHMRLITKKECYVNGIQVSIQHVRSEPLIFDIEITNDNVFDLQTGGHTKASADGYWVFLKPLRRGNYLISFSGSCSGGIRKSGAEYHIKVI